MSPPQRCHVAPDQKAVDWPVFVCPAGPTIEIGALSPSYFPHTASSNAAAWSVVGDDGRERNQLLVLPAK
jgi:hypothetical protein